MSDKTAKNSIWLGVIAGLLVLAGGAVVSGSKQRGMVTEVDEKVFEVTPIVASGITTVPTKIMEKVKVSTLTLHIGNPAAGQVLKESTLKVSGVTSPKAEVAINDIELVADGQGRFSGSIELDEGENTIVIVANDTDGNYEEEELVVIYEP